MNDMRNAGNLVVPYFPASHLYASKHRRNNFNKLIARLVEQISQRFSVQLYETSSIWLRDWFPINIENRLIFFVPATDYMSQSEVKQVLKNQNFIYSRFPFLSRKRKIFSNIVLDGGNVVMDSCHAIISRKVVSDNVGISEDQLTGQLSDLLGRKIILIETEPEDPTGHADGQCQFLADGILLINDLNRTAQSIWKRNLAGLKKSQLAIVPLPYHPTDKVRAGWPSLEGNYVNFIATSCDLIVSTYGDQRVDDAVGSIIREADPYKRSIRCIDTSALNELGGGLRCLSWLY